MKRNLNENGELAGPMRLSKILDIDTSIEIEECLWISPGVESKL